MYAIDKVILVATLILKTSAIINRGMELPYCLTVCFMLTISLKSFTMTTISYSRLLIERINWLIKKTLKLNFIRDFD